jgi:hypothetical protein
MLYSVNKGFKHRITKTNRSKSLIFGETGRVYGDTLIKIGRIALEYCVSKQTAQ